MDKDQVTEVLVNIATLLKLDGEHPFKTRAFQDAARKIDSLSESVV
jgi:DNA polymerase (family X)